MNNHQPAAREPFRVINGRPAAWAGSRLGTAGLVQVRPSGT